MQIQCVHCGKQYSLRDENVGSQFACRSCGKLSPIAAARPDESAVVAPLPPPAKAAARPAEKPQVAPAPDSAEPIEVECRHCGKQYKLRAAAVGMQFKCKQCGGLTPLAARSAAPEQAPSAPPPATPMPAARAAPLKAAPLAAKPAPVARPVARPPAAAPLAAMPVEPVTAELVAEPLAPRAAAAPTDMLDLLNDASMPAAGPVLLSPAKAWQAQEPVAPAPKPKRRSRAEREARSETLSRVIGGFVCVLIGLGILSLGLYGLKVGHRRAGKVTLTGLSIVVIGFLVAIGKYNAK